MLLLPVLATGRAGRAGEKGRKQKAFPILEGTWKAACLRALSVEELSRSSRAGFLAFGSSQDPKPSHPSADGQWRAFEPSGTSLADYSGGTAADSHGFPFYPRCDPSADGQVGAPRERFGCQRPLTGLNLAPSPNNVNGPTGKCLPRSRQALRVSNCHPTACYGNLTCSRRKPTGNFPTVMGNRPPKGISPRMARTQALSASG